MHSSLSRRTHVWAVLLLSICALALGLGAFALPLHLFKPYPSVQNAAGHAGRAPSVSVVFQKPATPKQHPPAAHKADRTPAGTAASPPTAVPLYTFPGQPGGQTPQVRLTLGSDGNFYGVTLLGGGHRPDGNTLGTAYRMTPDGTVTQLATFGSNAGDGTNPEGPLVEGVNADGTPNGVFFGTAQYGGTADVNYGGTVFMLAPDAGSATGYSLTTVYSFTGGADGGLPFGGLTLGRNADGTPDGYLYGTTSNGGNTASSKGQGNGVVFRISTSTFAESVLYAFPIKDSNGKNQNGSYPRGELVQRHDAAGWGDFIGITVFGGASGNGTVFSITKAGVVTTIHDFQSNPDGQQPAAGLIQSANGSLYGTTAAGGIGYGTVYRLVPDTNSASGYTYSQIVQFDSNNHSSTSTLIEASDGNLYGTGNISGTDNLGSVFRIDADPNSPTGFTATSIFNFRDPTTQGQTINPGLVQGLDGDLYGAATNGGSANAGTIYRLNVGAPSLGIVPAPTITSMDYQVIPHTGAKSTSTITVNGTNFVDRPGANVTNVKVGTGLSVTFVSATQITLNLDDTLPAGSHDVKVTNPDGQSATATLTTAGPRITSVEYHVGLDNQGNLTGTSYILVHGAGFVDSAAGLTITNMSDGTVITKTVPDSTLVRGDLDRLQPVGDHTVTVTNPDGQSATATFTTYAAPQIAPPIGYHYNSDKTSTVTINGTDFVRGGTVTVSNSAGTSSTVSLNNGTDPVGTQYTVQFSSRLPAGDHTITVTNPDGLYAVETLTTLAAPQIAPPITYQVNTHSNTATITVNGAHFVSKPTAIVSNAQDKTTTSVTFVSAAQITIALSKPLRDGDHTVTVTNPDGQTASARFTTYPASGPNITHLQSIARADGSSDLVITGTNFVDTPKVTVTNTTNVTDSSLTAFSPTSLTVHLSKVLPPGSHIVTVTNPDGKSGARTLITYGKPRIDGAAAITQTGGEVRMVVSGVDFYPGGYNDDPSGATVIVRDSSGNVVPSRILAGPGIPANIGDPQQIILSLGHARNGQNYSVEVDNSDGQTSHPGALSRQANARPQAQSAAAAKFNVYTSNQTQYKVGFLESILAFFHLQFLLQPSGNASPTQLLPGDVSLIDQHPCLLVPSGPGSIIVGLVASGGGNLVASGGGNVVSNDGGSIVASGGGNIVASGGGNLFPVSGVVAPVGAAAGLAGSLNVNGLVDTGNGKLVASGGGNLVASGGGNLVASGGGNLVASGGGNLVASGGGNLISHDGGGIVASGGGNLRGNALPLASAAQTAVSFSLTRFDQGAENGTGSTDAVVIGQDENGKDVEVLRIRYTPGQPDVVTYQAPGLVLTATNGTTAPQISNPAPTLASIAPGAVTAGGGPFILSVTGALFTDGTVIHWNGQPLTTTVLSGTQATAPVPASLTATMGTVRVTVTNPAPGGGASAPLPLTIKALPPLPTLHTFAAGLQMLSVPEDFSGVPLGTALAQPDSFGPARLFVWDPAALQYGLASALRPGQGYWARFAQGASLYDLGSPTRGPFAVPLHKGWNMIGDPFPAPVALSRLLVGDAGGKNLGFSAASQAGLVAWAVYGFPAGSMNYQIQNGDGTLQPYQGYWLYAFQGCTLTVPAP